MFARCLISSRIPEALQELLQLRDDSVWMRSAASATVAVTLLPATLFCNMSRTCAVFAYLPSRILSQSHFNLFRRSVVLGLIDL